MKKNTQKIILSVFAIFVLTATYLSTASFEIPSLGRKIETELEARTGIDLRFDKIKLKLLFHPAARITMAEVYKNDAVLFKADLVDVKLSLLALLTGTVAFKDITVENAVLHADIGAQPEPAKEHKPSGEATLSDTFDKIPAVGNLTIKKSVVRIDGVRLTETEKKTPEPVEINVDLAYLNEDSGKVSYGLEGRIKNGPAVSIAGDAVKGFGSLTGIASIRGLTTDLLSARLGRACGCEGAKANIDADAKFTVNDRSIDIKAEKITVKTPEFSFNLKGEYDKSAGGAFLNAALSSGKMQIKALLQRLPYALFSTDIASTIKKLDVSQGDLSITSARIAGTVDELKDKNFYKKPGAISLKTRLSNVSLTYDGIVPSIANLSGQVELRDNDLTLSEFSANLGDSRINALNASIKGLIGQGEYDASIDASLKAHDILNLARNALRSDNKLYAEIEKFSAYGNLDVSAKAAGALARPQPPRTYSGKFDMRLANLKKANTGVKLDYLSGIGSFTEKRISIGKFRAARGASHIELEGDVSGHGTPNLSYELGASGFLEKDALTALSEALYPQIDDITPPLKFNARAKKNRDGLTVYASADTGLLKIPINAPSNEDDDKTKHGSNDNAKRSIEASGLEVLLKRSDESVKSTASGSIKIKRGMIKGHRISDLSATINYDDEKFEASPLVTMIDGGSLSAWFTYYRKNDFKDIFKLNANITDARLEDIISASGASKDVLVGPVSGRVELVGKRVSEKFPRGVNGRIELASSNGSLRKFVVLNKMFAIVNIISITELFETGFPYNKLAGDFDIKNGIIFTDNLAFDGSSMRMSAFGSLDPVEGTINCTIGLHPFVTFDKIVSVVPIANWLILDREGNSASLYYELKGPLEDMSITPLLRKPDDADEKTAPAPDAGKTPSAN